jgi:hypothetical protein
MMNFRQNKIKIVILALLELLCACRHSSQGQLSELLSMETSAALEEACRRDSVTADTDYLLDIQNELGACLGSSDQVKSWSVRMMARMESNWPKDFQGRGDSARKCLHRLTLGAQSRYLETLMDACRGGDAARRRELLAVLAEKQIDPCFEITSMTSEGCFVARGCEGKSIKPQDFGLRDSKPQQQIILCSERIQRIHGIKDPSRANLLYNYSYVSELTGNQSSNRITYGPPNCHGVAQAAAGGVLDDLRLETVQHARLANQARCEAQVSRFFKEHASRPISDIPMSPGGVMINMTYDGCSESDCGRVALWVEDCKTESLELSVFIDGMCVNCWEKKLALKNLKPQPSYYSGKQLIPGCILTTQDHSVMVVARSQGMCFFYEATSPYGPPQIRAVPCPVVNHKFTRQYCPPQPTIDWFTP